MKTTRKILSVLLVLAMVSALFVVGISAEGENTAYQENAYVSKADGVFSELPANVTYLSVDGDDEDTNPDLLIGTGNESDGKPTTWNKNIRGSAYITIGSVISDSGTMSANNIKGVNSGNKTGTDEIGDYRTVSGKNYYRELIYLGNTAAYQQYGIGVYPSALVGAEDQQYVMFDVTDYDVFYSAIGYTYECVNVNPTNINKGVEVNVNGAIVKGNANSTSKNGSNTIVFYVYGSPNAVTDAKDSSFVLLAESETINGWEVGEFNVDISAYKTLKLVVSATDKIGGSDAAWGNACVYSLNDFSVNYDGNGGKTADDKTTLADSENITKSLATTATIVADGCTFEKEGYTFTGWNTKVDGTGDEVKVGDAVALTTEAPSVTLYAQWEEKAADVTYYKVTFVADGTTVSEIEVEAGKDATVPAVPAKEGYTGAWDKDGKAIAADTTITAVYTINTYTVTFVIPGQENTTAAVEHGKDVTLPAIPEKAGFTGSWDHDGKAITADTTITASYVRTPITVKPGDKITSLKGATNKVWLSDLYAKDIKDAATHTLVENPKYVVYSYVQKNNTFKEGRLFAVNVNFFNRAGIYGTDGYTHLEKDTLETNGKTYKNTDIVLGKNGTILEKGLAFQPAGPKDAKQTEVVFDVSSLKGDHFYAVVGLTGMANNDEYLTAQPGGKTPADLDFMVYGSNDNKTFELLASCEGITDSKVGVFNVNIEGYKYIKLSTKNNATSHNNEAVWANACVYTADANADTADGFSMTAVAAAIVAATSVVALVVTRKKFF